MKAVPQELPYTSVDHDTWRRFFAAIEKTWAKHADLIHPFYLANVDVLRGFKDRIPSLAEINELLAPIEWTAVYVEGLAPPWEIARWLDRQVMPISRSIRGADEVFFANGPDLIHDFFGHLPTLFNKDYRRLLQQWTRAASRVVIDETDRANFHLNKLIVQTEGRVAKEVMLHLKKAATGMDQFIAKQPSASLIFDKIYFWIFEFGIIERLGGKLILGAGLLSSLSEIDKIANEAVKTGALDRASVLSPYNISSLQDGYLVVNDLQQYQALIAEMLAHPGVAVAKEEAKVYAHA